MLQDEVENITKNYSISQHVLKCSDLCCTNAFMKQHLCCYETEYIIKCTWWICTYTNAFSLYGSRWIKIFHFFTESISKICGLVIIEKCIRLWNILSTYCKGLKLICNWMEMDFSNWQMECKRYFKLNKFYNTCVLIFFN